MSEKKPYFSVEPHRIGVMIDLPESPGCSDLFVVGLEIAFEEALSKGIGDRPVELIVREYTAQPWKGAHPNVEMYRDLVENEKVIGIAGPMTTDNSLSLLDTLDELKVPSIAICGSQYFVGDYAFNTPNGGMADEPMIMAAYMKSKGYKSMGIVREYPSQIGEEYMRFMRYAARIYGLDIVIEQGVSPKGNLDDINAVGHAEYRVAMEKVRAANPDCFVYLGLGHITAMLSQGFKDMNWDIPRVTNTSFVGAAYTQAYIDIYDGWVGLDQWHEENPVFQKLMTLYEKRTGERLKFPTSVFTCGYDIGWALALGLDRMTIATGKALRDALETVTRMPAATGAPGTTVAFSPRNHRGFKGADYLILRESKNGKNLLVGTAPIELD